MKPLFVCSLLISILAASCTAQQAGSAANSTGTLNPAATSSAAGSASPETEASPGSFTGGSFDGQVLGAGEPIAKSTVTLFDALPTRPTS